MHFRRFLLLHKSDRQVVLTLLLLFVAGIIVLQLTETGNTAESADSQAMPSAFGTKITPPTATQTIYQEEVAYQPERFIFDPNTADSTQLLRLGLKSWQVRSIYRYRAHGGVYRRKEDFARLYGLTVGEYEELEPYIRIGRDYQPASTLVEDRPFGVDSLLYPKKIAEGDAVILNTADTTELRTVPGIGAYFSREIIRYGQRLGGYVSVDQLDEIDCFPQESKKFFVIDHPDPRKLNVNKLSLSELRRHPYINYYQARAITDYRRLHGPLHSLDDLRLLPDFPDSVRLRLAPYVEF